MARCQTAGRESSSRLDEIKRRHGLPGQLQAARVVSPRSSLPPDAVDTAENVRFVKLRARAAELVPAAGIDHDQTAVGVFEHVGGMKIKIGAG